MLLGRVQPRNQSIGEPLLSRGRNPDCLAHNALAEPLVGFLRALVCVVEPLIHRRTPTDRFPNPEKGSHRRSDPWATGPDPERRRCRPPLARAGSCRRAVQLRLQARRHLRRGKATLEQNGDKGNTQFHQPVNGLP